MNFHSSDIFRENHQRQTVVGFEACPPVPTGISTRGIIKKICDVATEYKRDGRINQNGVGNARPVDARKALRYQDFTRHEKSLIFPRGGGVRARERVCTRYRNRKRGAVALANAPSGRVLARAARCAHVRARSFYRKYNWRFANPLTGPVWQVVLPYYRRWAYPLVIHSFMLSTA